MAGAPDPTTDPRLRSFVEVPPESHFPIQNLPFGVFRPRSGGAPRPGVRIGDTVLDLGRVAEMGWIDGCRNLDRASLGGPDLNPFLALGRPAWREARALISKLLRADEPAIRDHPDLRGSLLRPMEDVEMLMPVRIGDYTDFYSSREHASNVGTMFRGKDQALMPNWLHLPVAYHGRASSIVPHPTPVVRPRGQVLPAGASSPVFSPSRQLDFELEMGFLVGPGSELGRPVPVTRAREHIFGLVLVNDWSARDIQRWEYQPLGPFNAKNFATSISPWVVTLEALAPFSCPAPVQEPEPLAYLRNATASTFDIRLEVWLRAASMKEGRRICESNFRHLYWTIEQQLAHHTITGCNLRSGTCSPPAPSARRARGDSAACWSWPGTAPARSGFPPAKSARFWRTATR